MDINKVIVAGAGKSGISAMGLLLRHGASVILFDQNKELDTDKVLGEFEEKDRISIELGELREETIKSSDLFVISPGIPTDAEFVKKVEAAGLPVWGEIELAYYYTKGTIAAITGTNGKTTTTTLVGEIFKAHTDNTLVVGNIGLPYTKYADTTDDKTLIAAEISSFQLETVHEFKPHVSAVLNLTPDHLNRHYTLDNYYNAKLRIAENQDSNDYIILNYDDPETKVRCASIENTNKVWFSRIEELSEGVFVSNGKIVIRQGSESIEVMDVSDIKILGTHNLENVLAAVGITFYMGIPVDTIRETVKNFQGVEHRIEFVRELNGVKYYNDSKGTNPDAAIKAIQAMDTTTVLIAGGYDKKSTYDEWIEAFDGKVRYLILIGATAGDITKCAEAHGFNDIIRVDSLKDAVITAYEKAQPGDNVLLSPACASWDMFKSYEERGTLFKEYVNEIEG